LADYYNWLGILGVLPPQECFQPAIEAATKAIELDDALSDGHASLGFSLHAGNYEWSKAEHHLRRAMELNPSNANAFVWYSIVLYTEGRFDEGLDFARRGAQIDPLTPFNHHNIGWGLYYARRFAEAAEQYRRVVADFPTYSFGYYGLSKVHRITEDTKLAITENDRAKELMGDSVFSLLAEAECYAADGQELVAIEKIEALEKMSAERHVSPYQLALSYAYLGNYESALDSLDRAVESKEAWLNWLGVEPAFDPIRNERRFDEILEKTGYRMFFKNFSSSVVNFNANGTGHKSSAGGVHDLTTLVIDETDKTDDGTPPFAGRRSRMPIYASAAAALILAASVGGYYLYSKQSLNPIIVIPTTSFQNPSIVVVPFTSDEPGTASLGFGLADALTQKLGSIKALRVLSAYTGRAIDVTRPKEVAKDLGVAFILKGKLVKKGNATTLSADLVNTASDAVMWSETFTAEDGDLPALQTRVAEKLLRSLHIEPLPLERQQIAKTPTRSPAAYEHYLVGRSLMGDRSAENLRKAIDSFSDSLKSDPQFALAYVGLADSYALLNLYDIDPPADAYEKAKDYVQRALAIDESIAVARGARCPLQIAKPQSWNSGERYSLIRHRRRRTIGSRSFLPR
ncbi:MAG: tetratricopeptide repeat protein, partial [Acidobacteriota bacterium]